jgi:hypothetical protein
MCVTMCPINNRLTGRYNFFTDGLLKFNLIFASCSSVWDWLSTDFIDDYLVGHDWALDLYFSAIKSFWIILFLVHFPPSKKYNLDMDSFIRQKLWTKLFDQLKEFFQEMNRFFSFKIILRSIISFKSFFSWFNKELRKIWIIEWNCGLWK